MSRCGQELCQRSYISSLYCIIGDYLKYSIIFPHGSQRIVWKQKPSSFRGGISPQPWVTKTSSSCTKRKCLHLKLPGITLFVCFLVSWAKSKYDNICIYIVLVLCPPPTPGSPNETIGISFWLGKHEMQFPQPWAIDESTKASQITEKTPGKNPGKPLFYSKLQGKIVVFLVFSWRFFLRTEKPPKVGPVFSRRSAA